jgi:hypothetical protein
MLLPARSGQCHPLCAVVPGEAVAGQRLPGRVFLAACRSAYVVAELRDSSVPADTHQQRTFDRSDRQGDGSAGLDSADT